MIEERIPFIEQHQVSFEIESKNHIKKVSCAIIDRKLKLYERGNKFDPQVSGSFAI